MDGGGECSHGNAVLYSLNSAAQCLTQWGGLRAGSWRTEALGKLQGEGRGRKGIGSSRWEGWGIVVGEGVRVRGHW